MASHRSLPTDRALHEPTIPKKTLGFRSRTLIALIAFATILGAGGSSVWGGNSEPGSEDYPWLKNRPSGELETPEWSFRYQDLKRFPAVRCGNLR
jgi:hypothetical protein